MIVDFYMAVLLVLLLVTTLGLLTHQAQILTGEAAAIKVLSYLLVDFR